MPKQSQRQSPIWTGLLIAAAILFSFALACGMPFAAIGALAALTLASRDAALLAGLGWFTNQVIGFGFLGYPFDAMTIAWGGTLGLSAFAAVAGAGWASKRLGGAALTPILAFLAAWAVQQTVILVASLGLGGTASAFAPSVVWFIFWTNALAFGLFLGLQAMGSLLGIARRPRGWADA